MGSIKDIMDTRMEFGSGMNPYTTPLNSGESYSSGWVENKMPTGDDIWSTLEFLINSDKTTEVTVEQSDDASTVRYTKKYRNLFRNTFHIPILCKYVKITLTNISNQNQTEMYFDAYFSNGNCDISKEIPVRISFIYTRLNSSGLTPDSTVIPTGAYPATPQASYSHDYSTSATLRFDSNGERVEKTLDIYDENQTLYNATPNGMFRWYGRTARFEINVSSTDTVDRTVYYKCVVNEGDADSATVTGSFTATAGVTTTEYVFVKVLQLVDDTDTFKIYLYADDGTNLSFDSYGLVGAAGGGGTSSTLYSLPQLIYNIVSTDIICSVRAGDVIDGATPYTHLYGLVEGGTYSGNYGSSSTSTTYAYPFMTSSIDYFSVSTRNGTANDGYCPLTSLVINANVKDETLILTED